MAPSHRALWIYHAIEETEHKAVAYDVYTAVAGGSYLLRVYRHLFSTFFFIVVTFLIYVRFMLDSGNILNVFAHLQLIYFLLVDPGVLRIATPIWLDYLRPNFHPSDRNTVSLIKKWELIVSKGSIVPDQDIHRHTP